jgi:hypothetical protein
VVVAELLQSRRLEPVGFVDDQQLGEGPVGIAEAARASRSSLGYRVSPMPQLSRVWQKVTPLSTVRGVLATAGV